MPDVDDSTASKVNPAVVKAVVTDNARQTIKPNNSVAISLTAVALGLLGAFLYFSW